MPLIETGGVSAISKGVVSYLLGIRHRVKHLSAVAVKILEESAVFEPLRQTGEVTPSLTRRLSLATFFPQANATDELTFSIRGRDKKTISQHH